MIIFRGFLLLNLVFTPLTLKQKWQEMYWEKIKFYQENNNIRFRAVLQCFWLLNFFRTFLSAKKSLSRKWSRFELEMYPKFRKTKKNIKTVSMRDLTNICFQGCVATTIRHFIPPGNTRKAKVYPCLQGV